MNSFISAGVDNILCVLSGHSGQQGAARFPNIYIPSELWKIGEETPIKNDELEKPCPEERATIKYKHLQEWFAKVFDLVGYNFPDEKIAIFAETAWEKNQTKRICIQSICMKMGTLTDFYLNDPDSEAHYYRLDYDITCALGAIFKESHPHLHIHPKGEPRIPFNYLSTQTIIPDFINFLYMNYAYDIWKGWVRGLWKRNTAYPDHEDPFDAICEAFDRSKQDVLLKRYPEPLKTLKGLIRNEIMESSTGFKPTVQNGDLLSLY